ncbi:MAG TPA: AAA family ATPase [Solirubrobacterales bacterium]|nr:AAA family ATPase [Solirubrobacterales bacterium]
MRSGAATSRDSTAAGPVAPTLVERDRELAAGAAILDAAVRGAGRALLVEGDAGVGKTRLLGEVAQLAGGRGITTLRARGAELERGFAFGAVRRLLEPPVAELDGSAREHLFAGAAAPARALLGGEGSAEPPPRDARFALVHGLYWVCVRLAERRPLALLVDDFQWLDQPSAEAIAYLLERIDEQPIAIIVAARTGERGPLGDVHALEAAPSVGSLTLSPLTEDGTRRVLAELLGSAQPAFGATAYRVTSGNPFLILELALAVASEGIEVDERGADRIAELVPATVTHWALRRLAALPEASRSVARSLAVLEEAPLAVAAADAGLSVAEAAAAVDDLTAAGLVEGDPLRLTHPLVRAALYEQIPPANRGIAHRGAAEALRDCGSSPARIASHLMRSQPGGERWAVDSLRAAAGAAMGRGDPAAAVPMLRRAVSELGSDPDEQLLLELGLAEAALGDGGEAIAHLRVAAGSDLAAIRLGARAGLAHAHYVQGAFREAFAAGREVLAEIPPGAGGRLEAELLMSFLMAGRAIPELVPELPRWLEPPRTAAGGEMTAAELVRLQTSALDAFLRGRRDDARASVRRVVDALGSEVPLAEVPSLLPGGAGFVLAGTGDHARAAAVYERALEHALTRGSPVETAEVLEARVSARWWRGDVRGCLADVEAIHALVGREPDPAKLPMRMCQATMLLELGDEAGAEQALTYPPELEAGLPGTWGWLALPYGRAAIAVARRDWRRALGEAQEAGRRLEEIEARSPEFLPWRTYAARAAAGLGDERSAIELAQTELELAEAIGSPRATGVALSTLGVIERSADRLADAASILDPAGSRLAAAAARLALGSLLRRERRQRDARAPLREALDIARIAGSTVLAERARAELLAAGGRPRRERTTGLESLTPRERQIAELAARGIGNPEIAERLFVTRKTVESHLRSVFRKLGVRRRAELAAALAIEATDSPT